jgi:protein TonB
MKITLTIIYCLFTFSVCAQKNKSVEKFYVFDKDWKGTTTDKAVYMIYVQQKNDTTWQWNYYNYIGPLLYIESYRNEKSDIPNGYHAYFNKKGKIDSSGDFINGIKNGSWFYYGDSLNPQKRITYENGLAIKQWIKTEDITKDVLDPNEKEAEFKKGMEGWKKYLLNNLSYPTRALNSDIHGQVSINFIVDSDGKVIAPQIIQSVEFSLDQEAKRVILDSPIWKPGFQLGKFVNSYHTQPISF